MKDESLTVDGSEHAPISIRKVMDKHFPPGKELMVLVNNSPNGFDFDNADAVNISIEARVTQANYFIDEVFMQLPRIPGYLYRFISYFMFDDETYTNDTDYINAIATGTLDTSTEEYLRVYNFIKWGKSNSEATHAIGLIQLISGSLNMAKKQGSGVRLFLELPETGFHPKRQSRLMSLLERIKKEYA